MMKTATLEKLIWVLIYGGLLTMCLGLFVRHELPATGWTMTVGGALVSAVGAVLIWVRSRMS